ncbi:ABC transporter permease [Amphibacillus indicireducens]|uniref:ABC transporter permease n=1 Tax=Amphibacillus indicireducens TaxID=1076330 RepID=A0ABP7W2P4_9BACI
MNLFHFELKKIKNKRFLYLLVLIPIITVITIFTLRIFNDIDFSTQERIKANQLLADLNHRIPYFYYAEQDPTSGLNEEEEVLYDLIDQAERERFNYSVTAYYEDWIDMNIAKQKIWNILIDISEIDPDFRSVNIEDIHMEKQLIDWAVEYDIGTHEFDSDQNSLFVLFNSFQWLFSLPAILLIIFFFSLSIFLEPNHPEFNYSKVLPVSYPRIMVNKLALFFSIIATYIFSIITGSLLLSLFDSASLKAQLNYPVVKFVEGEILSKPFWQVLLFQVAFFIVLTLLALVIVSLLARLFTNELFITFIVGAVSMIGMQMTRLSPPSSVTYNPFAWLDTANFLFYQQSQSILIVLVILFIVVLALTWFVLLRNFTLPNIRRRASYRGIRKKSKLFLLRFEWLKLQRQSILFYSTAIIVAFTLFSAIDSYQFQEIHTEQASNDYLVDLERLREQVLMYPEQIEMYQQLVDDPDTHPAELDWIEVMLEETQFYQEMAEEKLVIYESIESDILMGDFSGLSKIELAQLKDDYLYVARTGEVTSSPIIPLDNAIFMPNAYINYRLSEWKVDHEIDFVAPGGPYQTLFIPSYQESPRSGEMQPPSGIDRETFDLYLDAVNQDHRYLSGLNLLADVFNQYFYLAIFILLIGFYSLSYAREWDGQGTIRYLLVQPISLKRTFRSKMLSSLSMGFCFILITSLLVFLIGSFLNGIGQLNFPFVQYVADSLGLERSGSFLEIPMAIKFFRIVPLWQLLLMGAGLLLSNVFLINQLVYYLSTFSKNQWAIMGSTVLILGIGYLVSIILPFGFQQFLPFLYLDISSILSGEIAIMENYPYLNWWVGMIVQIITGSMLTVLAIRRVRKY